MSRVAAVVAAMLVVLAAVMAPAHAVPVQAPLPAATPAAVANPPAGVTLVHQSTWVPVGGEFAMVLHLDDAKLAAQPGAAIAIRVHEPALSRSAFDDVIAGHTLGGVVYQPAPIPVASLHPDAHHNVALVFGLPGSGIRPTLALKGPNVYPVEVGLTNTGVPTGSFVSWLVTVDTRSATPIDQRLNVAFVWSLVADPATRADGSVDPSVTAQMRPGGRLDRVARVLEQAPFPYSLVAGPETLQTWQHEAQRDAALAPGLSRVRRAANRGDVELMPTPYVPLDPAAVEAAGLGDHLADEYRAGARALRDVLGTGPSDHAQSAFVDPVNDAAVDRLRQMLVDRVAVRDGALVPVTHPFTPAQTFVLDTAGGRSRGAATAPFVESLFDGSDAPALRAQRVIAALTEIAYEQPAIARGVVLAPPARWNPDPTVMATVIDAVRGNPLFAPATLDDFFTTVTTEQTHGADLERRIAPAVPTATPLDEQEYDGAFQRLAAYRSVVGANDPVVVNGEQALLLALSTSTSPATARADIASIDDRIQSFTSGVTADAKRITLTARRAKVPFTFLNTLKPAREVTVRVHLDSSKLVFPDGADRTIVLKPGNNTVQFKVEARTSGTFPMTISVTSANGRLQFGAPVRVTVRSAVFGGYAVALTIAALAFLALWWANHFRRTRRSRRIAANPAPVT